MTQTATRVADADQRPILPGRVDNGRADPGAHLLAGLTDQQREAATAPDGPVLVLAGAGTGKTKVLTTRIGWRLQQGGISPANVLALTFTHKAADEMKNRLETLIGPVAKAMDIGTFHAVFAKAIRECEGHAGLSQKFTILDETDQKHLLQDAFVESRGEDAWKACKEHVKAEDILEAFGRMRMAKLPGQPLFAPTIEVENMEGLLKAYTEAKLREDVADYDDILFAFDKALDKQNVLELYRSKWTAILADEYQDVNALQESILVKLASKHRNITCVGDDDQSIYSFRQADVRNILEFEQRWPDANIVRLEKNFRSTAQILNAANQLIACNTHRHGKTLETTKKAEDGSKPTVFGYANNYEEAEQVVDMIAKWLRSGYAKAPEIAIISRTASALQSIEHQLVRNRIPYTITAGKKVSDRMEMKVIAAYARVALNPQDETAFLYAFQSRKSGLGKMGLSKLAEIARSSGSTIEEVMRQEIATLALDPKKKELKRNAGMKPFIDGLDEIRALAEIEMPPAEIVKAIIEVSDIQERINEELEKAKSSGNIEDREKAERLAETRINNIAEILNSAEQCETLSDLTTNIVLSNEREITTDNVWLGTIHAAKGLEWNHVFLPAFENGIIPSPRSGNDKDSLTYQEERNLAYVAITRAKMTLHISYAFERRMFGSINQAGASIFLEDVDL